MVAALGLTSASIFRRRSARSSIASLMLGKFSNGLHERPLHVVRGLQGQPMFEFVSQVP